MYTRFSMRLQIFSMIFCTPLRTHTWTTSANYNDPYIFKLSLLSFAYLKSCTREYVVILSQTNVWPFETFHGLFHWLLTSYKMFMHRMKLGLRCRSLSSVGPVFNITENVVSSFRRVVFAADSTYAFWRRHSTPVFCYLVNIYFSTTSML